MSKSFLTKLFGLTVIIAAIIYGLRVNDFFDDYRGFVWTSLIFLSLTTVAVYFIMLRAMAMKAHSNFVVAFGTGFAIKSLASLAFLCYYIYIKPIPNHNFVFPFFIMYFAYTGLLVWDLWQQSKRKPLP
jgi:hypothetical protein